MSYNRRQILKTAGAVGAGSLLTVGSAGAQETCFVKVDEFSQSGEIGGQGSVKGRASS